MRSSALARCVFALVLACALVAAPPEAAAADWVPAAPLVVAVQQPQPPPAASDEFVPLSELPPDERLPAAPLLVAAYAFVWLALVVYLLMIWRRLARVEGEIAAVARRVGEQRRDG